MRTSLPFTTQQLTVQLQRVDLIANFVQTALLCEHHSDRARSTLRA